MPTDIRLDEADGEWVVVQSAVLKSSASDFMLDAPGRRGSEGGFRRALVHDDRDGLTINFSGDYPGGVTVSSGLGVAGGVTIGGDLQLTGRLMQTDEFSGVMGDVIASLKSDVATLKSANQRFDPERVDRLEQSVASLAALLNATVIPPWRTKEEVEEGDDMGMLFASADSLGLVVEFLVMQDLPDHDHGEVLGIEPKPGTVVLRGSTVQVTINLQG